MAPQFSRRMAFRIIGHTEEVDQLKSVPLLTKPCEIQSAVIGGRFPLGLCTDGQYAKDSHSSVQVRQNRMVETRHYFEGMKMLVVVLTRSTADCIITLGLDRVDQPPVRAMRIVLDKDVLALTRLMRNHVSYPGNPS